MKPVTFTPEVVDPATLTPHPRNYRSHSPRQLDEIETSIRLHGYYRNVVVARDGTILAGHGVVAASLRMGAKRVPVIRLNVAPDDPKAIKVLVSDNEISNLATVDDRELSEMLRELMTVDDLAGTGYDEEQLAALLYTTRTNDELMSKDHADEWIGLPDYEGMTKGPQLIVTFDNLEDRQAFIDLVGFQNAHDTTRYIRWPERREDLSSIKYVAS
jgi:ParB-like chromosome segregation protein Spo0J